MKASGKLSFPLEWTESTRERWTTDRLVAVRAHFLFGRILSTFDVEVHQVYRKIK